MIVNISLEDKSSPKLKNHAHLNVIFLYRHATLRRFNQLNDRYISTIMEITNLPSSDLHELL